jgi:protein-L-isoaspartate(D-aspartate) O-methyltransferase
MMNHKPDGHLPVEPEAVFLRRRHAMVRDQLEPRRIRDPRVLEAMMTVPRERFMPPALRELAYEDQAVTIGEGQTISQPFIVAYMTEQLLIAPQHRVLEVGTGSGYQAAILCRLAAHVYSIERIDPLRERAAETLRELGYDNITLGRGDGSLGWAEHAPYDRIIVTAGAPAVPRELIGQLTDNGRMLIPVGNRSDQRLICVSKLQGRVVETPLLDCRFVRLIGEAGWGED